MSEEKPKEGVKTENDHINLKVAGQDGSVVQFKIKRHTPLSKLMKAYCERQGLSIRQIRFRFDGQPINETDTPAQLEMEDEDTIDVFQQQTGVGGLLSCLCTVSVWTELRVCQQSLCWPIRTTFSFWHRRL
uniref:Ubiquitin-like domain-containing protein n=1 Tax=Amphiprion ocellaris TaxID=80972 RepID=A0AAQ5YQR1_AMPOC